MVRTDTSMQNAAHLNISKVIVTLKDRVAHGYNDCWLDKYLVAGEISKSM